MDAHPWDSNYVDPQSDSHTDENSGVGRHRGMALVKSAAAEPPLTNEQTRIHIPGVHRENPKRPPKLADALDVWGLAASAANVAMQMSWPEVGRGVVESPVESGSLMKHPWKRLRTTASYLAVAILGTDDEKLAMREAVNGAHRQIRSQPGAKVKYNAFDRNLQQWVAACLYVGFEDGYQLLYGKMSPEQTERFYRNSASLGTTLQVNEEMWPTTRAEFDVYWNDACRRVSVDDEVRAYVNDLLQLRMIPWYLRIILGGLLRFLTAGFLPPYFREQLGVEWTAADQRRFEHLFLFVAFFNRFLPRFIRNVGNPQMAFVRWRIRHGHALV